VQCNLLCETRPLSNIGLKQIGWGHLDDGVVVSPRLLQIGGEVVD